MMQVSSVSGVPGINGIEGKAIQGTASAATGTNDFMLMLLAQLKNQNPMEPLNENDMMSQFAQLNSVQELQSIRATVGKMVQFNQAGYGASLIGKVARVNKADGTQVEGTVTGITVEANKLFIQIGEEKHPLESVIEVKGA